MTTTDSRAVVEKAAECNGGMKGMRIGVFCGVDIRVCMVGSPDGSSGVLAPVTHALTAVGLVVVAMAQLAAHTIGVLLLKHRHVAVLVG